MPDNIRKMADKLFMGNSPQIFPDKFCAVFFHLFQDFNGKQVTRKKLICEPLPVFSIQLCPLPADRLRNQKTAILFLSGIERGRMHLYVIDMLCLHSMFQGNCNGVPGQLPEIRRMPEEAADAAGGKHRVICLNRSKASVPKTKNGSSADLSPAGKTALECLTFPPCCLCIRNRIRYNVQHGSIFHQGDVRKPFNRFKKMAGNLLPRDVLVE